MAARWSVPSTQSCATRARRPVGRPRDLGAGPPRPGSDRLPGASPRAEPGPPPRLARPPRQPRLHRHRDPVARPRHRRQRRHLQPAEQRGAARPASAAAAGAGDAHRAGFTGRRRRDRRGRTVPRSPTTSSCELQAGQRTLRRRVASSSSLQRVRARIAGGEAEELVAAARLDVLLRRAGRAGRRRSRLRGPAGAGRQEPRHTRCSATTSGSGALAAGRTPSAPA